MQRKLSEIAEIPKILSSTLATVSQTFDKLVPGRGDERSVDQQQIQRKYSYDEDAVDYELNDDDDDDVDDNDDDNAKEYDESSSQSISGNDDDEASETTVMVYDACKDLAKKLLLRELTPESDYVSTESENDDDEDENKTDDMGMLGSDYDSENDNEENVYDDDKKKPHEEEDFLTTSFTWRLRKVPKLLLNDEPNENEDESDEVDEKANEEENKVEKHKNIDEEEDEEIVIFKPTYKQVIPSHDVGELKSLSKEEKIGPLERAWPWADRTKIIYKQSTCHLVPRQPLGIIEKSKQLLAKQNLLDKLQKR